MWSRLVVVMLALAGAAHADDDRKPVTYTVDGEHELPPDGVHARDEWELRIGTRAVAFEKLTYVKSTSKLFAPPMEDAREPTARTAWFTREARRSAAVITWCDVDVRPSRA